MEKTLTIDGRQVKFKSSGGNLMRYRNQFNSEFLADFANFTATSKDNLQNFSFASMERLIWVLAKTADDTIPDPQTWYDSFEDIDILEVWNELSELTCKAFETLKRHAKNA